MKLCPHKGLAFRLLSSFVFIIVVVLSVQTVMYILRAQKRIRGELVHQGELLTDLLANSARIAVFTENRERLQESAAGVQAKRDVVLVGFYGIKYNPLYVSSSTNRYLSADIDGGVTVKPGETLTREKKDTIEFVKPVVLQVNPDTAALYFGETGDQAARIIGYVRIVISKEPLQQQMKSMLLANAVSGLVFIGVTIVAGFLWVKRIARPIETLTEHVKALGRGGEAAEVPVETSDEIGRLASAFNTMLIERRDAERALQKVLMDIHDGIGGITTNISLLSEIAQKAAEPAEARKAVATISGLAREGMGEIRSLMYSLDREDMTWRSLGVEIRNQGMKMVEPHAIAFEMTSEIDEVGPEPGSLLCLSLLRIYRETLMNAIKHAKAKKVKVVFRVRKDRIILKVCDDGAGFEQSPDHKGRGIPSMRARASEIGGTVTIVSDHGVCVTVELPVTA